MYYRSYLQEAIGLTNNFDGSVPLHHYLKKYFAARRKFGSRDRKYITSLCYSFYRLGRSCERLPPEERLLTGFFLTRQAPDDFLEQLRPVWNKKIQLPVEEKIDLLEEPFAIAEIFPWKDQLTAGIDHTAFCYSFLVQPDLFLRVRPGFESTVAAKLGTANIPFHQIRDSCISLSNGSRIDSFIALDREAVIQDFASQEVASLIPNAFHRSSLRVWDCCAGSGGKSIMLFDQNSKIDLTVSDIRRTILANLEKRFLKAGISKFALRVADLTRIFPANRGTFSLILADVPCSGSGTWSRTPEAAFFFRNEQLEQFYSLQTEILRHVIPALAEMGWLIYSTCSVFRKENEDVVDFCRSQFGLEVQQSGALPGYHLRADTLYAARLTS